MFLVYKILEHMQLCTVIFINVSKSEGIFLFIFMNSWNLFSRIYQWMGLGISLYC